MKSKLKMKSGVNVMGLVSIVIAAYNIENYISRCIKSVVNQTYKNIEIIIVNDGSSDNTLNIIMSYAADDNRIKIINQENKGLIEARKSGYKYVRGEFLLFIDGDDWIEDNTVEVLFQYAKEKAADIVQYKCIFEYDNGEKVLDWDKNIGEFLEYEYLKQCFLGNIHHNIWSQFIRKGFIEENRVKFPKDISYGEDLALTISLAINEPKVIVIDKYLYHYYQRSTSLSNDISKSILDIGKATEFIKSELINHGLQELFKEEFEYMAFRQNFYSRRKLIFGVKGNLSKKIFDNWKSMNINMNNNKYYKVIYENDNIKAKIVARIMEKSYYIGKIVFKFTQIC